MKNIFLKSASSFASVLGLCTTQAVYAQNIVVSGNQIIGNQSGTSGQMVIQSGVNNDSPYIHMFTNGVNDLGGSTHFIAGYSPDPNRTAFSFTMRDAPSNANWQRRIEILQSGAMRIGASGNNVPVPTSQSDYKLAVAGKIVSQSIYVTNPNSWADFVFEPTYKPMPLPDLESYLQRNKHLPYIPSAKEVAKDGYNVTEMDAKLLQTLEELTLQVIELKKEIDQLKAARVVGN